MVSQHGRKITWSESPEIVQAAVRTLGQVLGWWWRLFWRGCEVHLLAHEQVPVCVAVQDPHTRIVRLQTHQASAAA